MGYEIFHHHGGGRNNVLDLSENKLKDGNGVLKVVKGSHVFACLHQTPTHCT
jgi:hypothetical protein